jgi:hypothetical protein
LPRRSTIDARWTTPDHTPDFLLIETRKPQMRYAITFFERKLIGHRWDSVPKGKVS